MISGKLLWIAQINSLKFSRILLIFWITMDNIDFGRGDLFDDGGRHCTLFNWLWLGSTYIHWWSVLKHLFRHGSEFLICDRSPVYLDRVAHCCCFFPFPNEVVHCLVEELGSVSITNVGGQTLLCFECRACFVDEVSCVSVPVKLDNDRSSFSLGTSAEIWGGLDIQISVCCDVLDDCLFCDKFWGQVVDNHIPPPPLSIQVVEPDLQMLNLGILPLVRISTLALSSSSELNFPSSTPILSSTRVTISRICWSIVFLGAIFAVFRG